MAKGDKSRRESETAGSAAQSAKEAASAAAATVKEGSAAAVDQARGTVEAAPGAVQSAVGATRDAAGRATDMATQAVGQAGGMAKSAAETGWNMATHPAKAAYTVASAGVGAVAQDAVQYARTVADRATATATSTVTTVQDKTVEYAKVAADQAQELGSSLFEALPEPVKDTTTRTYTQVADVSHSTIQRSKERVDYWAKWLGGELYTSIDRLAGRPATAGETKKGQPLPKEANRLFVKDGIQYVARARSADRKLRKWPDGVVSMGALLLIWYLSALDLAWWRFRQGTGAALATGSRLLFG